MLTNINSPDEKAGNVLVSGVVHVAKQRTNLWEITTMKT